MIGIYGDGIQNKRKFSSISLLLASHTLCLFVYNDLSHCLFIDTPDKLDFLLFLVAYTILILTVWQKTIKCQVVICYAPMRPTDPTDHMIDTTFIHRIAKFVVHLSINMATLPMIVAAILATNESDEELMDAEGDLLSGEFNVSEKRIHSC